VIANPHFAQVLSSEASSFSRLVFLDQGIAPHVEL